MDRSLDGSIPDSSLRSFIANEVVLGLLEWEHEGIRQ